MADSADHRLETRSQCQQTETAMGRSCEINSPATTGHRFSNQTAASAFVKTIIVDINVNKMPGCQCV